jgi:hypothetical protein
MADNVAFTPGSGATGATDDIGGVHYPRVKLSLGADGTANDASAGAGAVGTGTQRVTLASDDPAVVALQLLDNAISGSEMQVDVVAALPAGTNNIGDVDVLSLVPGTGATALGKAEDAAHSSGDTGVALLGVRRDTAASGAGTDGDYATLNLDSTGHLYVSIKESQLGGSEYETVAASQTTQTLGATGGTGDYLDTLIIVVSTAATAQVSIKDGSDSAIVVFPNNPGAGIGTYPVPIGLFSRTGAWQITTGAGSAVIATGNFT